MELIAVVNPLIVKKKWSIEMQQYLRDTIRYYKKTRRGLQQT
jgi:hypothetical protein